MNVATCRSLARFGGYINQVGELSNTFLCKVLFVSIKYGYYHLDGAEVYNSEAKLGLAIKESKVPREKLFSSPTKVITNIKDIPNAIDSSLKKLQLDYVDLYLIHASFFASSDADLQSAWAAMEQVKASGKTKSSSPTFTATMKTATVAASINQIEYHPYLQHGGADAKGD